MTTFANTLEGGAEGATITTGNSGGNSGDAFSGTSIPANSTITYAASSAFHGTMGARIETTAASLSPFLQKDITSAGRNVLRFYFRTDSIPTSTCTIAQLRTSSATAVDIRFHSSTGLLSLGDTTSAEISAARTTNPLLANTWYRIELGVTPGATTTSGIVNFAHYLGDSTTALNNTNLAGLNLGSAPTMRYRIGHPSSGLQVGVFDFDDIAASDLTVGYIGSSQLTAGPLFNSFEGGVDNTTISVNNSAGLSGDGFTSVVIPANATITYATAAALHGSLGMRVTTTAASVATYVEQGITVADRNVLRFYVNATTIPSGTCTIAEIRTSAAPAVSVRFVAGGFIAVFDTTGTEIPGTRSTSVLTSVTWYRIEVGVAPGITTNSGIVNFAYYADDSTIAIRDTTATSANLGSDQTVLFRLGRPIAEAHTGILLFDDTAANVASSGYIGPSYTSTGVTYSNNFEGGTNGTTISSGNSGGVSGDPFATSIPANSTLTYASASAYHGTIGARVETTAANIAPFLQRDITSANRNAIRFYFKADTIPSATCVISQLRNSSASALDIRFHSTGKLMVVDATGTEIPGTRTTDPLVANTWYRIEYAATPGTTTSSGVVNFAYYSGDSTTAIDDFSATGIDLGATQTVRYRIGRPSPNSHVGVFHYDDAKARDISTGYIGAEGIQAPILSYEGAWNGTDWIQPSESERVWNGSSWQ